MGTQTRVTEPPSCETGLQELTVETRPPEVEFDDYAEAYAILLADPVRDRFSSGSDFFHRRKAALIADFFTQRKILPAAIRWLDVGCGGGELLALAGNAFAQAVGCDPSLKMMQRCEALSIYKQSSATELPFPDASFDFVTAVCVYHHVHGADRARLTESISRVLKPGGVFCIIEHNPWNPVTRVIVNRCPIDVDAELINVRGAQQILTAAGLEIIERRFFLYLPQRFFRVAGWIENYFAKMPLGGQFALFGRKPLSLCQDSLMDDAVAV